MATYAIGDIQGCYDELMALLEKLDFNENEDKLWIAGDVVNRGPKSLDVLRFLKNLPKPPKIVLGNHDLHLLAVACGATREKPKDTLHKILKAKDSEEILHWLRHQPLLHHHARLGYVMVHAGLAPQWDLTLAKKCATELENILQSSDHVEFFHHMYGNDPGCWSEELTGWPRLRFIANCFTRMRFCDLSGHLNLAVKSKIGSQPENLVPWFKFPNRANQSLKIIFGHWAALMGQTDEPNVYPLDTGCVWGNALTAMRLEDEKRIILPCKGYDKLGE